MNDFLVQELVDAKELNGKANCEVPFNMSEEMCKTGLWKTFVKDGSRSKPERRKGKSSDKHKHKHKHHHSHKRRDNRHKKEDEEAKEDEGLWMLGKKTADDEGSDDGSDAELQRKLSTINEDKSDVVIDMGQIQKSLLELTDNGDVPMVGEGNEESDKPKGTAEDVV